MQRSVVYRILRDRIIDRLPWVKYIDLQMGQITRASDNYPIPLPALLMELRDASGIDMLRGQQLVELNIRFFLYVELVTDSFNTSPQEEFTVSLLDSLDDLHNALHGYSNDIIKLTRVRELTPEYGYRYMLMQSDYKLLLKDTLTRDVSSVAPPNTFQINVI